MELKFEFSKATKNTMRFKEICDAAIRPVIGTLYIDKEALKHLGYTDIKNIIKITVSKEEKI